MLSKDEQIMALVYLLRELEWVHQDMYIDGTGVSCPSCGYIKNRTDSGHSWNCQLAQALDFYEDMP